MKIKKSRGDDDDMNADLITVNSFFAHHIKEISIARSGNKKQLIPTFLPYEINHYSDSMRKHMPKDSLKKLEKTMLYTKQAVH